jgi:UDP-3-O-acyl-N-acetylglucosamine deacetylase
VLEEEAVELRKQGLGSRTTEADLLIFGPRGPIGNKLRFANEPARHKCLDMIGDLALFGHDLRGHVVAYRSGHPLNIELVRTLHQRMLDAAPKQTTKVAA